MNLAQLTKHRWHGNCLSFLEEKRILAFRRTMWQALQLICRCGSWLREKPVAWRLSEGLERALLGNSIV